MRFADCLNSGRAPGIKVSLIFSNFPQLNIAHSDVTERNTLANVCRQCTRAIQTRLCESLSNLILTIADVRHRDSD
jgi:hypothetical protein